MTYKIKIKKEKVSPLLAGHPWVFSGALTKKYETIPKGSVVEAYDEADNFLGTGFYNHAQSIAFRLISYEKINFNEEFLLNKISNLKAQKEQLLEKNTNAFRLVNSDGDYLPGLVIDVYDKMAVFQVSLLAMEHYITNIVNVLKNIGYETIVEKSDSKSRKQEELLIKPVIVHFGVIKEQQLFKENGMVFIADPMNGQKTGFFLDQKEARYWVKEHSFGKKVLNLFSYSGAFSVAALNGGAEEVVSVDISAPAMELCTKNIALNFDLNIETNGKAKHKGIVKDVFEFLDTDLSCDILICDPPAFAKNKGALDNAIKGYIKLNRKCLSKLKSGDIFITSSCSGLIKMEEFIDIVKKAALMERKPLKVLAEFRESKDHSRILGFKEGDYLKTLVLQLI
jgi:23S rRNA (cytosine1962-C5)-methyltransferase